MKTKAALFSAFIRGYFSSEAASTSCFTPAITTNSSAPCGFAASSILIMLASRHSFGGGIRYFKYVTASIPVSPSCPRFCASGLISMSDGERSMSGPSEAPAFCHSASIFINSG